jgi:predicted NBD/HSP70 family sugar kinase
MDASKVNEVNITRVLQRIWLNGRTTRVELARELSLVKSTVSRITSLLLEQGLVLESPEKAETTRVGRKPVFLHINERYGSVVGIEIQPDFYHAVAIDLHGHVEKRWSGKLPIIGSGVENEFLEIMNPIYEWLEVSGTSLLGVGVAVAGIVDQSRGTVLQSNPLSAHRPLPFVKNVADRVPAPAIVENDANCGCWGELASRKNDRQSNFVFVLGEFRTGETEQESYWGIAIGLGIVLKGEVYHGSSYSAGEFQSILWRSGNRGQLSIPDEEIRRIKDDPEIMERALREVCSHVAFLVNTLNLTGVVFGGEIARFQEQLVPMLDAEVQRNWAYPNTVEYRVDFSPFEELAIAYGAAGMFLESLFSIPELFPGSQTTARSEVSVLRKDAESAVGR